MAEVQVGRRLVKSAPELWAEISDAEALARHLDEFGEIRITRVEPETTVAWEGDRARGTVEIAASGWGTKVTLTVQAPPVVAPEPVTPLPILRHSPAYEPTKPVVIEAESHPPEPEVEQVVTAPEPAEAPQPPTLAAPPRPGLFERLMRRLRGEAAVEPPVVAEAPVVDEPEDEEPAVEEPVVEEPVLEEPVVEEPVVEEPAVEEPVVEEPVQQAPASPDEEHVLTVLTAVLDNLGAAHHRPFSRG